MTNQPNNTPTQPTTPNPQPCTCTPNTHAVTGELGTGKGYTLKTLPTTPTP
ncbi:hypothetical protein [Rhodococcus qingshengii]|uniref:hypothetical protein n=1 Tax=Rhodococcus qingshengii TaxID=334542 RepID=UPI0021B11CE4|nr:hypothetical protein [Rhodococcus qingshengii]MCT6736568.1 hypothetical protein [Rhodococcus qingshengii]